jgi:type I restriction enzyme M protein
LAIKNESLEDSANLFEPSVLALEVAQELEAASEQFATIAEDLKLQYQHPQKKAAIKVY